jgi:hypothetical protein
MDGGLFLDKEADPYGRVFYSVKHPVSSGGSVSLYTALKWVYPDGSPKPLSYDLISALRAQEGDIREALTTAMVNNAAKKELERQRTQQEAEGVRHEWEYEKRGKKYINYKTGQ